MVFLVHLPTQSFGVCHNELDSMPVAEITETFLIIQRGVSEHHHLKETPSPVWTDVLEGCGVTIWNNINLIKKTFLVQQLNF